MPDAECVKNPILSLDLAGAGIATIIWATGFTTDYSWLKVDTFDEKGRPRHQRGVSAEPGIYFLGLPWQSRRGSSFIWGVWHDAKYLADLIKIQRDYMAYHESATLAALPVRDAEGCNDPDLRRRDLLLDLPAVALPMPRGNSGGSRAVDTRSSRLQ